MVNQEILVRDKFRKHKKFLRIFLIFSIIIVFLAIVFYFGYLSKGPSGKTITLEHPLKNIVFANTNKAGMVNKEAVVEQALLEFDINYINYLIVALGVNKLKKSLVGYGNPKIEIIIDEEVWSTEVVGGDLKTQEGEIEEEDIKVVMTKREAIEGLLSSDLKTYIVQSVQEGRTSIEMVAGKPELLSKGYFGMYEELTGGKVEVE